ncbi:hypothetical protein CP989_25285, partial [Enterobacter hormaechei]
GTPGKHQVEIVRRDADGMLTRGLCKNTDGTNAAIRPGGGTRLIHSRVQNITGCAKILAHQASIRLK